VHNCDVVSVLSRGLARDSCERRTRCGRRLIRFCSLFATEHRLAIFGDSVPSYREQLQCLLIGWLCECRCEASIIGSELSVLGNQVHGLSLIRNRKHSPGGLAYAAILPTVTPSVIH
jgi:hypothetical protein